jgi:hypothetical protein
MSGELTHIDFDCPVCGKGKGTADYRFSRASGGRIKEWLIDCWTQSCRDLGGAYLREVAEAVGAPNGASIKDDPAQWLNVSASQGAFRRKGPKLPSEAQIMEWHEALLASRKPLAYLRGRGLSLDVIEPARVGWDGGRKLLTFPMYCDNELVGFKTRAPRPGAQMKNWPGKDRPWPLYPGAYPDGWTLLVAGELDALCALSHGLPALSVTLGADRWREAWTEELRGRRVVICFDNNERKQARRRERELRAAGIDARRLNLRKLGLRTPKGDISDLLLSGVGHERVRRAANRLWRAEPRRLTRSRA